MYYFVTSAHVNQTESKQSIENTQGITTRAAQQKHGMIILAAGYTGIFLTSSHYAVQTSAAAYSLFIKAKSTKRENHDITFSITAELL